MSIRYQRAPTDRLLSLFAPGQLLSPLRGLLEMRVGNQTVALDVQFRERDEVMVYCGQTRVLCLRPKGEDVVAYAHKTYTKQDCAAGMLRRWTPTESAQAFGQALDYYLSALQVGERWVHKEGAVQVRWLGSDSAGIGEPPWLPIDREVVLGHAPKDERQAALRTGSLAAAWEALTNLAAVEGWKPPPAPGAANEVDQLALSHDGKRLILIELKHKADGSGAAYAPYQVMRYAGEWAAALDGPVAGEVVNGVNTLTSAKCAAGLVHESPVLRERPLIQPIVAFNEPPTKRVQRRLAKVVQTLRDNLSGPSIEQLEVWCWPDGGAPERLDSSWG